MSIPLSELYFSTRNQYQLNLIAGEKGLFNLVNWVQFTEDINTINFLRGGELIITTGMSITSDQWLFDFIKKLINQKTSGLILNTGKYIFSSNLKKELLELCNTHQYPLFTMPWKIHLSSIMQDYGNRLFQQNYKDDRIGMAFRNLIFHPEEATRQIDILSSQNFEHNSKYCILLSDHIDASSFLSQLSSHFKFFSFEIGERNVVVITAPSKQMINDLFLKFNKSKINFHTGISSEGKLLNISKMYYQAQFALKIAQKNQQTHVFFSELGINAILYSVSDESLLSDFYEQKLKILELHDQKNKSELLETLRLYLEYDGSIQAIADASYTHRNTINYRIKKIRHLLSTDLLTLPEKFNYRLAFIIREYLSLKSETD